jgi:hypothetical protein
MVEPQIVVLVVAGSSPVGHPSRIFDLGFAISDFLCGFLQRKFKNRQSKSKNAAVSVAQPDRASDFGSEGWGFESLQTR